MDDLESVIEQLKQELGEDKITTANRLQRPQSALDRQAFEDFMERNPMAGGGMLVQPGFGGTRQGDRGDKGRPVTNTKLTKKQVQEIYKDLPDNVYVMVQERGKNKIPEYTYRAGVRGDRIGKENWRMALKATPENKKKIIEATEKKLNEYYPNRLTREEYAKIRLKPENRRLRGEDFAKKLNEMGYTTATGAEWNRSSVYNFDLESPRTKKRIADDLGFFEKRTVAEAKEIIKKFSGGKHFLKNKNLTDADITTRAASYVAMEKFEETSGTGRSWPRGKQNKRKVWTNIYNSYRQGGRFELINEKELADADGKVNWKKDLNWRKAKFKDKKSGKTFTYDNLEKMVDKHGGGYQKAIKPYNDNAILNQTTFKGKTLNSILTEGLLKKEYETLVGNKVRSNDVGLLKYISEKKPFYSFVEAHHTEGVKDNPFKTEPAFKYANREQGIIQKKYNAAVASGDANKIAQAKEVYINDMNRISNELGGIRYKTEGKFVGTQGTPESIVKAAATEAGFNQGKINAISKQISENLRNLGFKCKFAASSGGVGSCDDPMSYVDDIKKQENLLKVQKINSPNAVRTLNTARKLNAARSLFTQTLGPAALAFEAVAALPIAYMGYKGGKSPENIIADATYGLLGKTDKRVFLDKAVEMGFDTANIKRAQDLLKKQEAFEKQDARADEFMGPDDMFMYPQMVQKAERDLLDVTKQFIDPKTGQVIPERVAAFDQLPLVEQGVAKDQADLATKRQEQVGGFLQSPVADYLPNFAGGGIAGLSGGIDKGPQRRSMNPDSQGLSGLLKRGIKT